MASLSPTPTVTRIQLVSDPDGWIDMKNTLQLGDVTALAQTQGDYEQLTIVGLSKLITAWNITDPEDLDENGEPKIATITPENVNRLPKEDYELIFTHFGEAMAQADTGLSDAEKKASPSGSEPGGNPTNSDHHTTTINIDS